MGSSFKQSELQSLYEEYCFLAKEACELSPAFCKLDDFIDGANKALQAGDLRAMRLAKLTMMDWIKHLDEPDRSRVCENFELHFGYSLSKFSRGR